MYNNQKIIQFARQIAVGEPIDYWVPRSYSSIGEASKTTLDDYIRKVANFAVLAQ